MFSSTEEDYLKAIYKLSEGHSDGRNISTNEISKAINSRAASVTEMLKRLAEKKLIRYVKYKGVSLTSTGWDVAVELVRKHRLWEVFLYEKLKFRGGEVHPIAEQLEHIRSTELTDRLESFLGFPELDPHGNRIPKKKLPNQPKGQPLSKCQEGDRMRIVEFADNDTGLKTSFHQLGIEIGKVIEIKEIRAEDGMMVLSFSGESDRKILPKPMVGQLLVELC